MSKQIGIFYGSSTCYTEMVAEKIHAKISSARSDLYNIANTSIQKCLEYPYLLFGIPTWDYGELQEDWENIWDEISTLDLNGKTIAIFGLGDQLGYPDWFQDAMGYLYHLVRSRGAVVIGFWENEGYDYKESKALTVDGKHFVGLALDDENQAELTDERIDEWLEILRLG